MKQFIDQFLRDYEKTNFKMTDEITGVEYSMMDVISNLAKRISDLEAESIETSNQLYELHNRLETQEVNHDL